MSLNQEERFRTARELQANLAASGTTAADVAAGLGWSPERLTRTLAVEGADPVDVWALRDALESAVREAGSQPVPFSVLTEQARSRAVGWFGIPDNR